MSYKSLLSVVILLVVMSTSVFSAEESWFYKGWHYRIPVSVDAGLYKRDNCVVGVKIDFKKVLKELKVKSALDLNSIRLTECDPDTDKETEVLFNYNPATSKLSWTAKPMESMDSRDYFIYLDVAANGKKPASAATAKINSAEKNLIVNGSFEKVTSNKALPWVIINRNKPGKISITDKEAHDGKYSLCISKEKSKVKHSTAYAYHGWKSIIPLKPKTKYKVSCWVKADGTGRQAIQMYTIDKNKKNCGHVIPEASGTHDWKYISKVITTNSSALFAGMRIFLASKDACTAYFDDVKMIELSEHPAPKITIDEIETK
jgi:carbohydrate binding protein with CBM4/9 domain